MRVLHQELEPPRACPYLEGRLAQHENIVLDHVTDADLEALLEAGIRHFGPVYFRPRCGGCAACVSIRVLVDEFAPTRSQRRVLRACEDVRVVVGPPVVDDARLALYARWHAAREGQRGWLPAELDERAYGFSFAHPAPSAREFSSWLGDRLVAVGISDETSGSLSAVYCFHEPDEARRGLGTFNVLSHLAYAREQRKRYVYLGYWVAGCPSLEYKTRFSPHERLSRGAPRWQRHEG